MTKHNLNNSKFTSKSLLQNNAHKHKFNPNYYPSVARVDSNLIESTCIFPETLKTKCITACVEKIQVNKIKNLISNNTQ